jgi:hypothetical protein
MEEYNYTQLILAILKYTRGRYSVEEVMETVAFIETYEEEEQEAAILSIVKQKEEQEPHAT